MEQWERKCFECFTAHHLPTDHSLASEWSAASDRLLEMSLNGLEHQIDVVRHTAKEAFHLNLKINILLQSKSHLLKLQSSSHHKKLVFKMMLAVLFKPYWKCNGSKSQNTWLLPALLKRNLFLFYCVQSTAWLKSFSMLPKMSTFPVRYFTRKKIYQYPNSIHIQQIL